MFLPYQNKPMIFRKLLTLVSVLFGLVLVAEVSYGQSNSTIWDAIYSEAQAARGKEVYSVSCVSCHAADLRGDSDAPSLRGMSFMFDWEGRSVGELFTTVQSQMPSENPNSLPAQNYLDVLAYIFQENNFPVGDEELSPEIDLLNQIGIVPESSR